MYDNGEGVAQNEVEAVKWYWLAAEQGDAGAQFNLDRMYGPRGAPQAPGPVPGRRRLLLPPPPHLFSPNPLGRASWPWLRWHWLSESSTRLAINHVTPLHGRRSAYLGLSRRMMLRTRPSKRQLVAERVRLNQQAGLVERILAQGIVTLSGRITTVVEAAGSGGFWSFSIKADDNNAQYGFMCSSYDELYFRIGRGDVDWETGRRAMRQDSAHVILYFRSKDWGSVRACPGAFSTCDGNACPLAIVIEPTAASQAVIRGQHQEASVVSQSGPAPLGAPPVLIVPQGIDANHAKPPKITRRSFAPKSKDDL